MRLSELFLRAVASGHLDLREEPTVGVRLAVLRARYGHLLDMATLLDDAHEAHAEAITSAKVAADRAYLESLIDGSGDLLSEDTFPRVEPMFAKYAEGSDMYVLLELAANKFSDAVEVAAAWVHAGIAIDGARRGRVGGKE